MPTTGFHRFPAISRTIGLTRRAAALTARRVRGPSRMVRDSLMYQGRGTAAACDVRPRCHTRPLYLVYLCMGEMIEGDASFAGAWSEHHGFLLDVAYRLLGSYSDAEDVVQEAFSRLLRTDLDPIEDVRAWLVVVVSRLCLDQLRSARVRHEAYVGPWFPEPLLFSDGAASDPADVVTMDESVRFALLVVLER